MLWHGKNFRGIINKAKEMIFDNTGTDLISTNAEDAIKEVNSNLSWNKIAEATADGVLTYSQLLSNLWTQISSRVNLTHQYMLVMNLGIDEWRLIATRVYPNNRLIFSEASNDGNGVTTNVLYVNSTGVYEFANTSTRTDRSSQKPTSGSYFRIYEKTL